MAPEENTDPSIARVEGGLPEEWAQDLSLDRGLPLRALVQLRHPDEFYITVTSIIEQTYIDLHDTVEVVLESEQLYDAMEMGTDGGLQGLSSESDSGIDLDRLVLFYRIAGLDDDETGSTGRDFIRRVLKRHDKAVINIPEDIPAELGISVAEYDDSDPLVFEPITGDEDKGIFALDPLGRASNVFRWNDDLSLPYDDEMLSSAAEEAEMYPSLFEIKVNEITKKLSPDTFEAAGIPSIGEATVFEYNGQRLAICYYPLGSLQEVVGRFFEYDPYIGRGAWFLHSALAEQLLGDLFQEETGTPAPPEEHPIRDDEVEPVVFPID